MNENNGLIINYSRGIIYASHDATFAYKAKEEALKMQLEMAKILKNSNFL